VYTCLSIRQPWAELILQGRKSIEVRSWSTAHRGELWLHAGARTDDDAMRRLGLGSLAVPHGALVGRCELYDCVEFSVDTWEQWRVRHLNSGALEKRRFAWLLRDPTRTSPKPMKGRLGLMRLNDLEGNPNAGYQFTR
jgi:activating signal cointegrator 1